MTPWWLAVGAAEGEHRCGGEMHRLVWAEGVLRVPAHTDPEAEQTLAALGGEVPECIHIRQSWATWCSDPALVTLGRRPGEASLGFASADGSPTAGALHTPPLRRRRTEPVRREALMRLLSLPPPLVDRLVLAAMAAAADNWSDGEFRARHGLRLGASLAARAHPSLERIGRQLAAPGEAVLVHATPAAPGSGAALRAERTTRGVEVTAALPLWWVASVWGAGLSEPDGHLVVAIGAEAGSGYGVDVIRWAPDGEGRWIGVTSRAQVARGAGGEWRVTSDGG